MQPPPELETLLDRAHPAALILRHAEKNGVLITLPCGMDEQEKKAALCYGTHVSALQEAYFIYKELADQVQAGHMEVLPFYMAIAFPNMWIYPISVIHQVR